MNEWFKKLLDQIKALWSKWTLVQKIILIGIVVVVIGVIIAVSKISSTPTTVPLFQTAITDEAARDDILFRLDQENVEYTVSATGIISVKNQATARRMKALLNQEGLVPNSVDPWDFLDVERWTTTDFERNLNKRNAIIGEVQQLIMALDDVDDANLSITIPEKTTFSADKNPTTASVVITPRPGSDITTNSKKIEGIRKLIMRAVDGLTAENITILDRSGKELGNLETAGIETKLDGVKQQQNIISDLENSYRVKILALLQSVFGTDRVRDLQIKIDMDFSEKTVEKEEHPPIVLQEDDPDTSYSELKTVDSFVLSQENVEKTSKGVLRTPEGAAGVEGENPPSYVDLENQYTVTEEKGTKTNYAIQTTRTQETIQPEMGRRTVSVNIDGTWTRNYDEKGNIILGTAGWTFTPVSDDDLNEAIKLVKDSIGYSPDRGDSVSVTRIQIDRTAEHEAKDEEERRKEQMQKTIIYICIGIAAVLIAFIVFRFISREVERKRRLKEEALLRQHQMEREKTLWEAEQAGMEVTMSIEERERAELQETAIAMAKEHPEDIAMLIRTWLTEE